jgi:hypothetical protein
MPIMIRTRRSWAVFAGLITLAAASLPAYAQTNPQSNPTSQSEKYTATTVNLNPGSGEPLSIRISRWSADAERERLTGLFTEKGEQELRAALAAAPTLGYIWTSETLGYSVHYAYRLPTPDGGERIILATDHRLGAWSREAWKALAEGAPDYEFTVLELRLTRSGTGEGKLSLGAKVAVEQESKTIALENYNAAPILLKDVKRERPGSVRSVARPSKGKN